MSAESDDRAVAAVRLAWSTRVLLLVIGVVSATAVVVLLVFFTRADPPDLLLTALAIGSLVCLVEAVIGRLPSGFQLAGLTFDFSEDLLSDLIGTVKSSLSDDPRARKQILELIEQGAGRENYRVAETRLGEETAPQEVVSAAAEHEAGPLSPSQRTAPPAESALVQTLSALATDHRVQERYEVARSGKGKPPIFDYFFQRDRRGIAVQVATYWNPSTVDLISRKTERALQKTTDVNAVVIVVPADGMAVYTEAIDPPTALVVQRHELADPQFANRLDDLLLRG